MWGWLVTRSIDRYFYRCAPPRPLEEIEADIRGIEPDILRMLAEVTGNAGACLPSFCVSA
jgi:type I restriction enzyme M protein